MGSNTRVGNLKQVFKNGESTLLNLVARMSVVYEDFRLEVDALSEFRDKRVDEVSRYKLMYLVRRSTATLHEFQGCLTQLVACEEYKLQEPWLTELDRQFIQEANQHFQTHCARIKQWRNDIGGHVQASIAAAACRNLPDSVCNSITYTLTNDSVFALRLTYAEDLVAAAIGYRLEGDDVLTEMGTAIEEIMGSYVHVQGASHAAVHAFLWDRFGR